MLNRWVNCLWLEMFLLSLCALEFHRAQGSAFSLGLALLGYLCRLGLCRVCLFDYPFVLGCVGFLSLNFDGVFYLSIFALAM